MAFNMNMSNEKPPKELIPEGWHEVKVTNAKEQYSKKQNHMIVATILVEKLGLQDDVYMITEEGKRWMLKAFLSACGISPNAEGVFTWDIGDIVGKKIQARFKHEPNEYINRNGETVHSVQHRVVDFKISDSVAWDE